MPVSSTKPLIPAKLLQELAADEPLDYTLSMSFEPHWHNIRCLILKPERHEGSMHPDVVVPPEGVPKPYASQYAETKKKTYLHFAAETGDPCVALEMIRMGATIDRKDAGGHTPLTSGLKRLAELVLITGMRHTHYGRMLWSQPALKKEPGTPDLMIIRIAWVCKLLIQQHADVNLVVGDYAPMDRVCEVENWELITLLLEHGANPNRRSPRGLPVDRLESRESKTRFRELVRDMSKISQRPAQPCPCWSGKLLSECHGRGEEIPYPLDFACRCGSGKPYEKCCMKRNMQFKEKWDPRTLRLIPVEEGLRSNVFPAGMDPKVLDRLGPNLERMQDLYGSFGFGCVHRLAQEKRGIKTENWVFWDDFARKVEKRLVSRGLVDPAFCYPLSRHCGLPIPNGRSISKEEGIETSTEWNGFVDEYIAKGTDPRDPLEIARVAKIGTSCGALYRTCEGSNCEKLEGKDVPKLLVCSKCKISVYCSKQCQASNWKEHKLICGKTGPDGQAEQMLPSQVAIQKYLMPDMFKQLLRDTDLILGNTPPDAK
ncbi:hypothetical protein GLOTRDRAFT_137953 [Gloeophyllum trabeum ATCC 11539]|uniref:MYND-type domain-containing protein n=1 Tax=Gloeophyllum trabeum (strain ATCC 11539 / FP-39264 / Madison 617) TaxID=670483 RepID=S7Q810_GLOTA|nr:uncharacterized protein GLOTRDRAFT_137953 [Gloeophyllum trabeum ATCC 11539]EPQ56121.1 hypothetical protein GLOTRDRAFT_137953 [Gloeophyllum trabeum ATCC 11539]